jgi:hypothetical protein
MGSLQDLFGAAENQVRSQKAEVRSDDVKNLQQVVQGFYQEKELAAQVIEILGQRIQSLEAAIAESLKFDRVQDGVIAHLHDLAMRAAMGYIATLEFSNCQDGIIEFFASLLADPNYLLFWAFEVWSKTGPSEPFMEVLSEAYLHLSNMFPPQNRLEERRGMDAIANGYSLVNSSSPISANAAFSRPNIPAPPIPSQSNNQSGWNGVRSNLAQGNVLQALRQVDTLTPVDWREMFN